MPLSLFKAYLDKKNLIFSAGGEDSTSPLNIKILAVTPGTMLPLRNESGEAIMQFEATEELIKGAVQTSRGGLLTVNHKDPINSRIGVFTDVVYDNGFLASGQIICSQWAKIVASGEEAYSGISIEGSIAGEDLEHPDSINIYAISFLTNEENPQGGACSRDSCHVEIDEEEDEYIEAAWEGSTAEKQIWDYASKDGVIIPSKAKKCFLKVDGDSTLKGSYSYPYVTISNGKPIPNRDGFIDALKYASGAGGAKKDSAVIRKIKTIMSKNGMELPPSLQARLEQKVVTAEDGSKTIVASVFDPVTDNLIDSSHHQVIIIDKGEKDMPEKNEAAADIPAVENPPEIKASVPEAPAAEVVAAPAAEVEVPVATKVLDWELVSQELGISSKDDFLKIKETADKVPSLVEQVSKIPDLEKKLETIFNENKDLRTYKDDQTKKMLAEMYPPAIVGDIAAAFAEYTKDPLAFTQKYSEDAVKFAASKNVRLQGSASESTETEEARKMAARKEKRDGLLRRTGGPVVR